MNEWQPGKTLGPAGLTLAIAGGTISILSFDLPGKKPRFRVQHQVAKPIVAGPAMDVFGGVAVGGGGIIIVGGKVNRVPPRSPVIAMLTRLARSARPKGA
ncbi:hypothetical protein [Pseudarthrobacter sp. PvP090]|uniref:hypothetical protein n=1 Tax=Pseudarthrobacter sp. PvP090 TaxID=3156393 RepID=UPI003391C194